MPTPREANPCSLLTASAGSQVNVFHTIGAPSPGTANLAPKIVGPAASAIAAFTSAGNASGAATNARRKPRRERAVALIASTQDF